MGRPVVECLLPAPSNLPFKGSLCCRLRGKLGQALTLLRTYQRKICAMGAAATKREHQQPQTEEQAAQQPASGGCCRAPSAVCARRGSAIDAGTAQPGLEAGASKDASHQGAADATCAAMQESTEAAAAAVPHCQGISAPGIKPTAPQGTVIGSRPAPADAGPGPCTPPAQACSPCHTDAVRQPDGICGVAVAEQASMRAYDGSLLELVAEVDDIVGYREGQARCFYSDAAPWSGRQQYACCEHW